MSLIKALLALSFRAGAHQFGFYSILAGLRCRDLGFSLIDSREGPLNASVLQLALAKVVLDSSSGRLYGRARLGDLRLIIVVLQLDQQISFVHRADNRKRATLRTIPATFVLSGVRSPRT